MSDEAIVGHLGMTDEAIVGHLGPPQLTPSAIRNFYNVQRTISHCLYSSRLPTKTIKKTMRRMVQITIKVTFSEKHEVDGHKNKMIDLQIKQDLVFCQRRKCMQSISCGKFTPCTANPHMWSTLGLNYLGKP